MEEDLSAYAVLPEELLEQVCENMDSATLGKFVATYSRAYHVCKKVYDEKKGIVTKKLVSQKKRQALAMARERERQKIQEERQSGQFGDLPDEALYNICSSMDNQQLSGIASNSARVRSVCTDILSQRGIKTQADYWREIEQSL